MPSANPLLLASISQVMAQHPDSWALWSAKFTFPSDVSVAQTDHGAGILGYGVDLQFEDHTVTANVWDTDGNAFFMLEKDGAVCKFNVGSDGQAPGLQIEVFEQQGLRCPFQVSAESTIAYAVSVSPMADANLDCETDFAHSTHSANPCSPPWHAPSDLAVAHAPSALSAGFALPIGISAVASQRGGDHGYGVDLTFDAQRVIASVYDEDGDAFFQLSDGSGFCIVDVGSDGQDPRLKVEVFKQNGLKCSIGIDTLSDGRYFFNVSVQEDINVDCETTYSSDATPCSPAWFGPAWHPAYTVEV